MLEAINRSALLKGKCKSLNYSSQLCFVLSDIKFLDDEGKEISVDLDQAASCVSKMHRESAKIKEWLLKNSSRAESVDLILGDLAKIGFVRMTNSTTESGPDEEVPEVEEATEEILSDNDDHMDENGEVSPANLEEEDVIRAD